MRYSVVPVAKHCSAALAERTTLAGSGQRLYHHDGDNGVNTVIRILATLPGVALTIMGVRWLVDPAGAAAEIGMPLLSGLARSSQIGDLAALFLAA